MTPLAVSMRKTGVFAVAGALAAGAAGLAAGAGGFGV